MNFIAEFDITTPILAKTRRAVTGLVVDIEDLQLRSGKSPVLVCWVDCDDFDVIDRELPTDPTVEAFEILAESSGRRLYRVALSEKGEAALVYPVAVEHGITFLEVRATDDGTHISARIPNRDVLLSLQSRLEERDVSLQLKRIYRADDSGDVPYGVSERQREILLYAVEAGFFEVPRKITLRDIAVEFDITDQAVSTLLRRGLTNLLRHTLASSVDT
ncbi:helix-turn-helix domain-containing protein [Haladaptatus pallidirubidus]|uniref:HTH DNA binding domain-containing protein n=1 Tax=Haladaptatus pallidirubidus TaxID=1008152 RepID=A0AAV3UDQ9_9EURY|nr:helix-turn-helix domain-containing protein [Haladaptatus pallidirubidus]